MKIVCATDLLPKTETAIARAAELADRLGADLTLLHVVSVEAGEAALEERLQLALRQITARVRPPLWQAQCTPHVGVRPGNPARLILDAIEQSKARLLVLGPHRRRPLRDIMDGTIVEKAIESRKCPVLIARAAPQGPYRKVLLALDASGASVSAVNAAATLVLTPDSAAQVIHVQEPPYAGIPEEHLGKLAEDATRSIRSLLGRERTYLAETEIRVAHGAPADGILRSIEQYQPDLLVMGTRGMGRLRRALLGSVASRVLEETERDTLIVPEGSFVAPMRDRATFEGRVGRSAAASGVRIDG